MVAMCVRTHVPMHVEATGPSCDMSQEDTVFSDIVHPWDMELTDYEKLASQSWGPTLPCLRSKRITNMNRHTLFLYGSCELNSRTLPIPQ